METPSCYQSFLARAQHTFTFDFQSSLHPPARGQGSRDKAEPGAAGRVAPSIERIRRAVVVLGVAAGIHPLEPVCLSTQSRDGFASSLGVY
jgi:hypothetical protein